MAGILLTRTAIVIEGVAIILGEKMLNLSRTTDDQWQLR